MAGRVFVAAARCRALAQSTLFCSRNDNWTGDAVRGSGALDGWTFIPLEAAAGAYVVLVRFWWRFCRALRRWRSCWRAQAQGFVSVDGPFVGSTA